MKSMYGYTKEPVPRCVDAPHYLPKPLVLFGMAVYFAVVSIIAAHISPAASDGRLVPRYASVPVVSQQAGVLNFTIDLLKKRLSRHFWTLA
ncbi:hypothetical protein [Noviherbaspirillum pedocola]|uniref:Uncharacterized protein n=1 Tax=Noviherbaspirillum pedocola TaxID=2801341 RepID=A0A934W7R7_9BURK|nr:hypothetical protein [Noviherbaspirillum pedocola]MBK4735928.1 hypothetical protein [Noviherbaspirillum pedocola]